MTYSVNQIVRPELSIAIQARGDAAYKYNMDPTDCNWAALVAARLRVAALGGAP